MNKRIRTLAKKKVSAFLLGEEGQVGRRGAFTAAALVTASALAAVLVATPPAAAGTCGGYVCCGANVYCCNLGGQPTCGGEVQGQPCTYMGPC